MTVTISSIPRTSAPSGATAARPAASRRAGCTARARPTTCRRLPERVYRRRRATIGGLAAVVVACSIVLAHDVLAGSGVGPASAAPSGPAPAMSTLIAQPGDSLWSIAERFRGEMSITRYVDALVSVNGGASIQAGQTVVLP